MNTNSRSTREKITTRPDTGGPHGLAWKFDIQAISARRGKPDSALIAYAVEVPWANSIWTTYVITVIHLRPMPEYPAPIISLPGATHEVAVYALDPEWPGDLKSSPAQYLLSPMNFVGQFIDTDELAVARINDIVRDIVNGLTSPDTDYIQHWIHRFSASNIKGDPKTAGQTIIRVPTPKGLTEIVFDPAPLSKRPVDKLCRLCKHPLTSVALPFIPKHLQPPDDVCIRCQRGF